ncbi:MAG: tetratricopeptide repeat protein [Planctomycetota bacterium]|nr:MAG: tetratricopeptide repeat protein [Planctomycetota bacterium]
MQGLRAQWPAALGGLIICVGATFFEVSHAAGAHLAVQVPAEVGRVGAGVPASPETIGSPAPVDPRWEVVRKLLRSGQYPAAESVARAMVKDRPSDVRAGFYLGLALHKGKRHGEALAYLERATAAPADSFPEAPHAVHYLGWCRYYLGDLAGARVAFTTHANAFPTYDDTQFALGLIAYEEDRLVESEAYFRRALELLGQQQGAARERAKNLARLGDVLLRQDRLPEAEQCYRRAVELFEQHGEAWSKLARVLDRLGRPEDAANARARQAAIKARTETEKPSP